MMVMVIIYCSTDLFCTHWELTPAKVTGYYNPNISKIWEAQIGISSKASNVVRLCMCSGISSFADDYSVW